MNLKNKTEKKGMSIYDELMANVPEEFEYEDDENKEGKGTGVKSKLKMNKRAAEAIRNVFGGKPLD
jgi:hypothetical protein